jgi:hypothetical protein
MSKSARGQAQFKTLSRVSKGLFKFRQVVDCACPLALSVLVTTNYLSGSCALCRFPKTAVTG